MFESVIFVALFCTYCTGSWAGETSSKKRSIEAGQKIIQEQCSSCHAVSVDDKSQHQEAPELRLLSRQYPVEMLAEALAEGIMSGHPDMPILEFDADQVDQIIDYLKSIQVR